ncbi:hypothetical protein [Haloarcula sp. CGMCC 1.2071]|uniref:hypothetical protein n=1 Tax=Haloarcula sp. CGMCC 1.2071 TaxID=3111454 RepID=UPI00300E9964
MSDDYLTIQFPYRQGDAEELKDQHLKAFENGDQFNVALPFVETSVGNFQISSADIPEITGMSDLHNYEYETAGDEWNLMYAPMVEYYLGSLAGLADGTNTESGHPLDTLIDVVVTGYKATDKPPLAAIAITPPHEHHLERPPFTAKSLAHDTYDHLSWLSIFTPSMVEYYGRETLLSAPAWKVRELTDGAILIVCHSDITNWGVDCCDIAHHIGLPWYADT